MPVLVTNTNFGNTNGSTGIVIILLQISDGESSCPWFDPLQRENMMVFAAGSHIVASMTTGAVVLNPNPQA